MSAPVTPATDAEVVGFFLAPTQADSDLLRKLALRFDADRARIAADRARIEAKDARIEALEKALRFYADEENYMTVRVHGIEDGVRTVTEIVPECEDNEGAIARAALSGEPQR